jgi:hypothetical protein
MGETDNFIPELRADRMMTCGCPLRQRKEVDTLTQPKSPSRTRGARLIIASALLAASTVATLTHVGAAGASPTAATVQVCESGTVAGSFPFSLNGGTSFSVAAGQCASMTVAAGENLVTEQVAPTNTTQLKSIAVAPQLDNVVHKVKNSKSQSGYAKVTVEADALVTVTFTNGPAFGKLKVCTIAGSTVLNGQYFTFTEQSGKRIVGPFNVQAEPASAKLSCRGLATYRIGTVVNIAEAATPNVEVSNVSGASWSGGQDSTATIEGAGTTVVTYTNSPDFLINPGYLEVCVLAGDAGVGAGPWNFTISGNGLPPVSESVLAGQCSGDVPLSVGDYKVSESLPTSITVTSITGDPTSPVRVNLTKGFGVFAVAFGTTETATFTDASTG